MLNSFVVNVGQMKSFISSDAKSSNVSKYGSYVCLNQTLNIMVKFSNMFQRKDQHKKYSIFQRLWKITGRLFNAVKVMQS